MPRPARLLLSQSYYHIMTRGNNKNIVFKKDRHFKYYIGLITKYKEDLPFDLYHYTFMPNHTHFLIKTRKASDFSLFMKKLNLSYFYYFKKQYGWVGHLWQDRFRSQPVGKDEYFIQCGKYIELNPVRAGIVAKPEDYPYTSYRYYIYGKRNDLITEDFLFQNLGITLSERQNRYKDLLIDEIVMKSYKKKIWGSPNERYNERKKINYNLNNRINKNYQNRG